MEQNKELKKGKQLIIQHGVNIIALPCPFCGGTDLNLTTKWVTDTEIADLKRQGLNVTIALVQKEMDIIMDTQQKKTN